jgi:hypothetical protein
MFQNQPNVHLFYLDQDRTTIAKLSAFRTGLVTIVETRIGVSKTTCEIDNKNRIEEQFISSQAFHRTPGGRVREITTRERFEPRNLEYFVPVTQELYQHLRAIIRTEIHTKIKAFEERLGSQSIANNRRRGRWARRLETET